MYVDRIIALYTARAPSHTQWDPWQAPSQLLHKGKELTGYWASPPATRAGETPTQPGQPPRPPRVVRVVPTSPMASPKLFKMVMNRDLALRHNTPHTARKMYLKTVVPRMTPRTTSSEKNGCTDSIWQPQFFGDIAFNLVWHGWLHQWFESRRQPRKHHCECVRFKKVFFCDTHVRTHADTWTEVYGHQDQHRQEPKHAHTQEVYTEGPCAPCRRSRLTSASWCTPEAP